MPLLAHDVTVRRSAQLDIQSVSLVKLAARLAPEDTNILPLIGARLSSRVDDPLLVSVAVANPGWWLRLWSSDDARSVVIPLPSVG